MGNGVLTGAPDVYTLPGVPWTVFFHNSGVAFHGAYWHNNFGVPMSHGCVNMRPADAKWLFRWTTPLWSNEDERYWEKRGYGTAVHVI
jgi:lipoprotein-anchoring transpeptidase ErfK/SrfK